MKLNLPDGERIFLNTKLLYEDRVVIVNDILVKWNDYFLASWNTRKTKVCLEILSNYLCLAKKEEDRNKEDKYVMSLDKIRKMIKGDSRMMNFSDLPYEHQSLIGIIDYADENEFQKSRS